MLPILKSEGADPLFKKKSGMAVSVHTAIDSNVKRL